MTAPTGRTVQPRRPTPARRFRLGRRARKVTLTAHLLSAVGWFGSAVCIAVFVLIAGRTHDPTLSHALYRAVDAGLVITLVAGVTAIGTGVILSIGTPWGLLLHWWIVAKLLIAITVVVTDVVIVRLAVTDAIEHAGAPHVLYGATVAHVVVLAAAVALAVFKPWGRTPRGGRLATRTTEQR